MYFQRILSVSQKKQQAFEIIFIFSLLLNGWRNATIEDNW
jgi:hypothetical protein